MNEVEQESDRLGRVLFESFYPTGWKQDDHGSIDRLVTWDHMHCNAKSRFCAAAGNVAYKARKISDGKHIKERDALKDEVVRIGNELAERVAERDRLRERLTEAQGDLHALQTLCKAMHGSAVNDPAIITMDREAATPSALGG